MDDELRGFIGDFFEYVEDYHWRDFKGYCLEKGYSKDKLDELESRLGRFIEGYTKY